MASKLYYLWLEYLESEGICTKCAIKILNAHNIDVFESWDLDLYTTDIW